MGCKFGKLGSGTNSAVLKLPIAIFATLVTLVGFVDICGPSVIDKGGKFMFDRFEVEGGNNGDEKVRSRDHMLN